MQSRREGWEPSSLGNPGRRRSLSTVAKETGLISTDRPVACIKIKAQRQSSQAESRPELGGAPSRAILPGSQPPSEGNQGALTSSGGWWGAAHSALSWFGAWISKLHPSPPHLPVLETFYWNTAGHTSCSDLLPAIAFTPRFPYYVTFQRKVCWSPV